MTDPAATPAESVEATHASAVTTGALLRYRVMAIITGTLLIVVFLGLVTYTPLVERTEDVDHWLGILSQVHGFVYVVYLVTVVQLWLRARWGYGRLATMFFGGVVPVLSFVVERRITRELRPVLEERA